VAVLFAAEILNVKQPVNILGFHHSNLLVIRPEKNKKTISVGQIHELVTQTHQTAFDPKKPRVVILCQAEKLGPEASAALLKTLEEPPGETIFILSTKNHQAILPTIRSRATMISLLPMAEADLAKYLEAQYAVAAQTAGKIAEIAQGLPEKAIRLTQPNKFANHQAAAEMANTYVIGTIAEKFAIAKSVSETGRLAGFLESLYFASAKQSSILVIASNQELVLAAEKQLASNVNPRLVLENMALQWSNTDDS
jgi:DNA polymerase III gamma/tau subunit